MAKVYDKKVQPREFKEGDVDLLITYVVIELPMK